jgi:hypothetical protein
VVFPLLRTWKEEKAMLIKWSGWFAIPDAAPESLTNDPLKESEALNEVARHYKTPLKTSQKSKEEEIEEINFANT